MRAAPVRLDQATVGGFAAPVPEPGFQCFQVRLGYGRFRPQPDLQFSQQGYLFRLANSKEGDEWLTK